MTKPVFKRVLVKLSGEALMGHQNLTIDPVIVEQVALELKEIAEMGVQVGVVIGGGNIFRGFSASARGMDRVAGDYMGMLATVINSIALKDYLRRQGTDARVMSAIRMEAMAELFIRDRAFYHLEKGRIIILAAGTGNPYFTTDTAAALRAIEIQADVILKGTKVDGVYDRDPVLYPEAKKYHRLSYMRVVQEQLRVMDTTAVTLCMDNNLPIIVFNLTVPGNLKRVILGEDIGTIVVRDYEHE